jgi:hypothetical protein
MITHVAIKFNGTLYSLPKPYRHHDVIRLIHVQTGSRNIHGEQGFLDEKGWFLNRQQALYNAVMSKQQFRHYPEHKELFSEDLW